MSESIDSSVPPSIPAEPAGAAATEDHAAPEHRNLTLALIIISAAQLMVVLDASVVNVALPSIQRALNFSPTNLVWVINAYTLAFGGFLLLGGRTGDLYGRRRMFIIGISIFTTASFLCGIAQSPGWLIGARVLQGLGGAIAAPTALSLIASTFPEGQQRNRAMGVYAAMSGAGGAIGVLLGGVLTSALGWRWVFFINVPIGLLVAVIAPRVLGETGTRKGGLDLPGALTATAGMSLVVFGLIHVASTSWHNPWTVVSLVVGGVLLATFVIIEANSRHALMPLSLFKNRNRSAGYLTMLAIGTAVFSMFYFLTLFIQNILGYSPLKCGLAFLPFALSIVITATVVSRSVGKVGVKAPLMLGTLLAASGMFWFSTSTINSSYWDHVLPAMILVAAGVAMCFVPLTLTTVSGVRRDQQGIASALLNSGQQVGGSLGLAVLGTIAATATKTRAIQVLHAFPSAGQFFHDQPPAPGAHIAPALQDAVSRAYLHGYTTALQVAAGILVFAFFIVTVFIRVPRSALAPTGDGETELAPAPH